MTDILTTTGPTARIRLNRPKALHALTQAMCKTITQALLDWRGDPDVRLILLDHAGGRGFCAGGDIRMLAESGAGDGQAARDFFRAEYRMNHLLFTYAKPIVAVMDGVTMGGGVGIALPASHRIATENTRLAMPETGIGLFPDVGGGWYLSRLPGHVGKFLAMTGARLDGAECLELGLATHFISSEKLEAVKAELVETPSEVDAVLANHSSEPPPARILANRAAIDRLFAADTLEVIIADLEADGGEWAAKELATLRIKSPQSCKVALRQLREGARMMDFADEMRMEYGLAVHIVQRHDFLEGVRALILDKDDAPRWDPATPEGVTDGRLDTIFAPVPAERAWTPIR